ncbi:MAG: rhodanese-like domain-containing protein [Pseudomonadota bacterium]
MEQLLEFTNNHVLLTGALVSSLFLVIFTEYRRVARAGTDLEVAQAIALINDDAQVIDIRPAEVFDKGHIAGARNVTADSLSNNEDRLTDLQGKNLIVACDSGMQCSRVVSSLRAKGYENVFALKGGIAAWQQEKLPLVSRKKKSKGKKS